MNRKYKFSIIFTLLIYISISYYSKYQSRKKENVALKIKQELLSSDKKKPISWRSMKNASNFIKPNLVQKQTISYKLIIESPKDIDLESLISQIEFTLKNRKDLTLAQLDRGIHSIDELISRNPNVYSSYKAKLILLLTKEGSRKVAIEDDVISQLLETMSGFDVMSERVLRKEAFLITKSNSEIDKLIESVNDLEDESEIKKRLDEIELLENKIENGLLDEKDYLNEDLVEIPLLRALSKEDYDRIIEVSETLLSEFPSSVSGHLFLIRALELSGRKEEAVDVSINNDLDGDELKDLELRLYRSRRSNPKEYWRMLRF